MEAPTYKEIKPYIEKGFIKQQIHPDYENVRIFNYTPKCQFDRAWDDVTIQCRGLILNVRTGEVIARPFPKFFNLGELEADSSFKMPDEVPFITEKYDGSLGIMYTLDGKLQIATRGSFVSDQAIWATKWWLDNKGAEPYGNELTHLFEIIYPENRIVVSYDFSGLVYLGSIETKTGKQIVHTMPVKTVETIPATDLETLAEMDTPNSEGFVIFFPKAELRMKIKFPEYVRLHKILTGLSAIGVWEYLRDNGVDADIRKIAEGAPDEFYVWLDAVSNKLRQTFLEIQKEVSEDYRIIQEASLEF